ncbi:MAG TPA: VOC family protein [Chloroflexaceae bacterium]|nr:VOC family protein [Chloroflexaceae bacterium]
MQISRMDHVAFVVQDVERSRQFYTTALGMAEVPRPESFSFPGAWFRSGTAEVHLIGEAEEGRAATLQPAFYERELRRGYLPHVAFEVPDLEAARRHLERHDVPLAGGPQPRGDGITQLYIRDPDGYVIELFARDGA